MSSNQDLRVIQKCKKGGCSIKTSRKGCKITCLALRHSAITLRVAPSLGEVLQCKIESGNVNYAVAVT